MDIISPPGAILRAPPPDTRKVDAFGQPIPDTTTKVTPVPPIPGQCPSTMAPDTAPRVVNP